jgi:hypothetical protein
MGGSRTGRGWNGLTTAKLAGVGRKGVFGVGDDRVTLLICNSGDECR